jgi:hypothetical protein|tara:strand:- start:148 stop:477 length:330 start_codon:yes stop_codon:yes gene_type:complete
MVKVATKSKIGAGMPTDGLRLSWTPWTIWRKSLPGVGIGFGRVGMIEDIDIFRTAQLYIEQHGDDAIIYPSMRADEMLDKGDLDGRAVWLRVMEAIGELQSTEPGGRVH